MSTEMAALTTNNDFVEVSLENASPMISLFKKQVEKLYDIKIKENNKKFSIIGERIDVQKAKKYLACLSKSSECVCHIYDHKKEHVNSLEQVIYKVERLSACYITKGNDCYFLIYGVDQEDVTIATSLLDAAIQEDVKLNSVLDDSDCCVVRDSITRQEEEMDFIADDDDDPILEVSTLDDSSMEMSQMMEDIMLESECNSPVPPNSCTIDLRSDDENDCIIISDNSVSVLPGSGKKKKKKKSRNRSKNTNATQTPQQPSKVQQNPYQDFHKIKLISPNACSTPIRPSATNKTNIQHPELARFSNIPTQPIFQFPCPDSTLKHETPNSTNRLPSPNSSVTPTDFRPANHNVTKDVAGPFKSLSPPIVNTSTSSSSPCGPGPIQTMQIVQAILNKNLSPNKNLPKTGLRKIVIDGSNVAMLHGLGKIFSCKGIELVVEYFEKRGHNEIAVFVPQFRRSRKLTGEPLDKGDIMERLYARGKLCFTPSRVVDGKMITSYDDRYILREATDEEGIVISNDQYRDLFESSPEFRNTIEKRLLQVTFVGDKVMFPDDPLGRDGPTLDEFLSHDRQLRPRSRHRSPMDGTNKMQPADKSRSSSCKPTNRIQPPMAGPSRFILLRQHQQQARQHQLLHRPNVPFNPHGQNLPYRPNPRPPHVTEELRRSLLQLPFANPGRVNYLLDMYTDCTDFLFLRALL